MVSLNKLMMVLQELSQTNLPSINTIVAVYLSGPPPACL